MNEYLIDLTEFISRPHATGIQRACGELGRNWPSHSKLQPVFLNENGQLIKISSNIFNIINNFFENKKEYLKIQKICEKLKNESNFSTSTASPNDYQALLVPEVFFDVHRIRWYQKLLLSYEKIFFYVYDFFPIFYPNYIEGEVNYNIYSYYKLITKANHVAFASERTRIEYWKRLLRKNKCYGPVIRCGSDTLKFDKKSEVRAKNQNVFLVLGSILPKKQHNLIIDAFEKLWITHKNVKLIFAGKFYQTQEFKSRIENLQKHHPNFIYYNDVEDNLIKSLLLQCRATICIGYEGYGITALESLWFKKPVIASDTIPALEHFGNNGIQRIAQLNSDEINKSILLLLNDSFYQKKIEEINKLHLPTWENFSIDFDNWISKI